MNAGRTWCATSLLHVLILLSLTRAVLSAQVIELKGGSSSLYQSQGGTVLVHGPGFNASAGGGTIGGKFYGGAQLVKGTERSTFILGSDDIAFDLPTDIFDSGHYITGIGAGFRTIAHDTPLYLFLGATSTGFDTPFFEGARAENPAAITTKINAQATYMVSKPDHSRETDSFNSLIQETLSSRWTASQIVNMSSGQTTFGYGGSFLSNFATISADYQTYYVPSRTTNPFEEALILSAQIHPIDKLSLQGDTFVAPDGRLLYTTAFASTISRQMLGSSNSTEHRTAGNMLLRGSVVDLTGKPVPGAAIMIDQMQIYSDSQGIFFVRERKRHAHTLTVLTDQFLEGGLYRVISAPSEIRSGIDDQIQAVIVVQQLR